ncbi:hypothetical protein [Cryptosporangium minutisporangium]|uniref:Uncharacterized protein n=1 Tax=Cryptosporangium minutisporangium TaxID=113569 RepID=A0ABP6TAF8_9ACTN
MIPHVDVEAGIVPELPAAAQYWMPAKEEMLGEGIGYFRGVWSLYDVTREDAAAVAASEQAAVAALDVLSPNAQQFDRLARVLETHDPSTDADDEAAVALLAEQVDLTSLHLGGLEVGVAGLSFALAAIGCIPAASCRGHMGDDAWSYNPIVFAAVDRPHADWLLPRVRRAKCGFGIGAGRENVLAIQAHSIVDLMALTASILRESDGLPAPPLRWGRSRSADADHRLRAPGPR